MNIFKEKVNFSNRFGPFVTSLMVVFIFLLSPCTFAGLLDSLRQEHPRLIFTDEVRDRVAQKAKTDPLLQQLIAVAEKYAAVQLDEPTIQYKFDAPGNPRLKDQRRASMFRVFNLGVLYRLTGDVRYAERIKKDLLAAAKFPNWGPSHFLNIGEISMLMAIGYDWIYDTLSAEERQTIAQAISRHGLQEGLKAYQGTAQDGWWTTSTSNWNQVCNGGLVAAALAVAEEDSSLAEEILTGALKYIPNAMKGYEPDGAWYEGPTYWAYGTTYNALLIECTRTALGAAIDWNAVVGYDWLGKSGNFHIQTVGPTNYYFNFGDSKDNLYFSPVLFWFSHTYHQPVYAWYERRLAENDLPRMNDMQMMLDDTLDRFFGLLIAWYDDSGKSLSYEDLPLDSYFRGEAAVGALRSGWAADAIYLGFKGGYNQAEHGHMDIGSFVLDALGVRWALDLGGDNYDLSGYFDFSGPRWQYFRCNNFGHNTLVLDGALQNRMARAAVTDFFTSPDSAAAVVNMTQAYQTQAKKAVRTFSTVNGRTAVRIQDDIEFKKAGSSARWGMITAAEIELQGRRAVLKQDGKFLLAELLEPAGATFEIVRTKPANAKEAQNPGTAMLATNASAGASELRITVQLTPSLEPAQVALQSPCAPGLFEMVANHPNPFNAGTNLTLTLNLDASIEVQVFDVQGRVVYQNLQNLNAGRQSIRFDAENWPSGWYFYKLIGKTGSRSEAKTGKMLLIK